MGRPVKAGEAREPRFGAARSAVVDAVGLTRRCSERCDETGTNSLLSPVEEHWEARQVQRQVVQIVLGDVGHSLLLSWEGSLDPLRWEPILLLDVGGARKELEVGHEIDRVQIVVDLVRRDTGRRETLSSEP